MLYILHLTVTFHSCICLVLRASTDSFILEEQPFFKKKKVLRITAAVRKSLSKYYNEGEKKRDSHFKFSILKWTNRTLVNSCSETDLQWMWKKEFHNDRAAQKGIFLTSNKSEIELFSTSCSERHESHTHQYQHQTPVP